ncbi:MAG: ParB/RepB/Spo0J family partition protein [Alphaproteobacteria bacterium]|nr:ParB/RepB/Spo0J family partition protein [Alphaproteobacteria bacterium]
MTNKTNAALKDTGKPAPLGRGLAALFGDADASYQQAPGAPATASGAAAQSPAPQTAPQTAQQKSPQTMPLSWLQPGRFQPRRQFDETALRELAASVRARGVLQPLLVRPLAEKNSYEIVAGERRWRAAQIAGVHDVPVVVRALSDKETLEVALVENIQRQDLSAVEEAEGYQRLMDEFSYTQEDLAKTVGKSRSHVTNMLRLLGLPQTVKDMLASGALSPGHARALIATDDPEALAKAIAENSLSVRDAEALAKRHGDGKARQGKKAGKAQKRGEIRTADVIALERDLAATLGLKVALKARTDGSGTLTVAYKDLEQLDGLIGKLRG